MALTEKQFDNMLIDAFKVSSIPYPSYIEVPTHIAPLVKFLLQYARSPKRSHATQTAVTKRRKKTMGK